ncbi:CAF17-like 4Fe-4S cluster assembly/insertion protein YgfZ [Denitromonas iodatirespirans]|uniref:Folate-binding protein YgfZ n=1 Tax=Denitromonas iodatirespirans TaxID=2795389 RepID=A0A944DFS6_DENI1|nr:folate-binding protein [Denitromonas iodatirespirans]MBT0963422.1 folate-binding protein YgfZ [Denitromonas iodatirespirans]
MDLWTQLLASSDLHLEGDAVCRAKPAVDIVRARDGDIMVPMVHLGLIDAVGDDAAAFLHSLFSNDVKKLARDAAQWTSFNSPKGRMLASMLLWHGEAGYRLALSADLHPALLKKLSMYVLRSKVKLADGRGGRALLGLSSATLSERLGGAKLPVPAAPMRTVSREGITVIRLDARRALIDAPAERMADIWTALGTLGVAPATTLAWQWLDVQAGIPMVTEQTQDDFVAQMLNYELIGGVNFQKGCYPGQEIVARTQYLGKLKKRMYRLTAPASAAPHTGDELYAPAFDSQSVGKLVTVVPSPNGGFEALAVLQMQAAEAGEIHLGATDGPKLRLATLPYTLEPVQRGA